MVLVPRSSSTYIRIENVDIVQSPGCVNNSLQIKDIGTGIPFASGRRAISFGKKVYIGSDKRKEYEPNLIMGSKYPYATSIFCGVRQGVDYYASSGLVMIKFLSSSKETSKGFKITYSTAGCSRNFTDEQGRIKLSEQNKSCKMHVVSPNPNSTIALYFSELRTFNFDQQDVLKIYDGMDTSQESKLLVQIKRNLLVPAPVFSHSSSLTISITIGSRTGPVSLDLTYTTTTEGRGCGGNIFNYGGVFTSPLYPRNVRNFTTCRWDVAVPYGGAIELEFTTFDLGPKYTCQTDYLQIYDVDPATSTEVLRRTYCGGDIPAKYRGEKGRIAVRYVTSIHNGGTGFVARFMSRSTDPSWPALIGEHLIS
ncbi:hypothetical protein GE061_012144 [Apolygus lucorum]|uniref:CUB domain-containing protein n=1 Tax=Apolygus lucorum TaxID=248454 RepID=A0A8S9XTJ0_APOLU|nr:hypothetical protein GE061_012144 [Apolygus lucorum]